ncbi:unnamed protein product [Vitrella brassicaformis CCMP3155]|uniref:EGF-like domain-containing protein n=1 Tax=Vitrella brassicaformis (strain CCMP3155) TaxID=1169540 RepID=A0A0G4FXB1_VITBC|nr:unnamed protein product [Vitrella brassicaformis CCMP3155]|eukprot:CEM20038.1 unnamed protein product [Vitrella brassicaformis CCMP3155]
MGVLPVVAAVSGGADGESAAVAKRTAASAVKDEPCHCECVCNGTHGPSWGGESPVSAWMAAAFIVGRLVERRDSFAAVPPAAYLPHREEADDDTHELSLYQSHSLPRYQRSASAPPAAASRQLQVAEPTDGLTRDVADGVSADASLLHEYSDWFTVLDTPPAVSASASPEQRGHAMSAVVKLRLLQKYLPFGEDRVMPGTSMRVLVGSDAVNVTDAAEPVIHEDCTVCEEDARGPLRQFIRSLDVEMRGVNMDPFFRVCGLPFIVCVRFRTAREALPTTDEVESWAGGGEGMVDGYIMVLDPDHEAQLIFPEGGVRFPTSFYDLRGLLGVVLMNAPLDGSLSDRIGDMVQLRLLYVDQSQLSGPLPDAIVSLPELRGLYLDDTQLNGTLPPSFHTMFGKSLEALSLIRNPLGFNVHSLFHGQGANSSAPAPPPQCTTLRIARLLGESITGSLEGAFDGCESLELFHMRNTAIIGGLPALEGLPNLHTFRLENSENVTGTIPAAWGNVTSLRDLKMIQSRGIRGAIPDSINNLTDLRTLSISITRVNKLPATIEGLQRLWDLDLSRNRLSGVIPAWLSNMRGLRSMRLDSNDFEDFEGDWRMPPMLERLHVSKNSLSRIPPNWRRLETIKTLYLSDNRIGDQLTWGRHSLGLRAITSPSAHIVAEILANPPPYWPSIETLSISRNDFNISVDEFLMPWSFQSSLVSLFSLENGLHGALTPSGVTVVDLQHVLSEGLLDRPAFRRYKRSFMAAYGLQENATSMSMVDPDASGEPVEVDEFVDDGSVVDVEKLDYSVTVADLYPDINLRALKGFEKLQWLGVNYNDIEEIRDGWYSLPNKLHRLHIAGNRLRRIIMDTEPLEYVWYTRHNWKLLQRANLQKNPDLRIKDINPHEGRPCSEIFEGLWQGNTEELYADFYGYRPLNGTDGVECTRLCIESQILKVDETVNEEVLCRCIPGYEGHGRTCTKCPDGTYSNREVGTDTCQPCPSGEVALDDGTACVCDLGYEYKNNECGQCAPGTFKPAPGNELPCFSCPGKQFTSPPGSRSEGDCFCEAPYSLDRLRKECFLMPTESLMPMPSPNSSTLCVTSHGNGTDDVSANSAKDEGILVVTDYQRPRPPLVNPGWYELDVDCFVNVPVLPAKSTEALSREICNHHDAIIKLEMWRAEAVIPAFNQTLQLGLVRGIPLSAYTSEPELSAANVKSERRSAPLRGAGGGEAVAEELALPPVWVDPETNVTYRRLPLPISTYDAHVTSRHVLVRCPVPEACEGSDWDNTTQTVTKLNKCKEGHTGPMCGSCDKGWRSVGTLSGLCRMCGSHGWNITGAIVLYVVVLIVIFIATTLSQRSSVLPRAHVHAMLIKIGLNHLTVVSALTFFGLQFSRMLPPEATELIRWAFRWDGGVPTADVTWECLLKDNGMRGSDAMLARRAAWIVFPLVWLTVATLCWGLWRILPLHCKASNLSQLCCPGTNKPDTDDDDDADSPHQQGQQQHQTQRAFSESGSASRSAMRQSHSDNVSERRRKRKDRWLQYFICPQLWVVCLTFIHPTVTRQLLEILPCRTFPTIRLSEPPGEPLEGPYPTIRRSLLDPSILCYTGQHLTFTIVSVVGLCVWSFGPVIAALSILCSYQRSGRLYKRQTRKNLGFLYNGYRRSFFYWDVCFALRRIAALVIAQAGASLGDEMIQLVCWQLVAASSLIVQLWVRPFDSRSFNILNRMEAQGLLIWNISLWCLMLLASTAAHPTMMALTAAHPTVSQEFQEVLGYVLTTVVVLINAYHIIALICHTVQHSLDVLMTSILILEHLPDSAPGAREKRDGIIMAAMRRIAFTVGDCEDRRRARVPTVWLDADGSELTIILDSSKGKGGGKGTAATPSGSSGSRRPSKPPRSRAPVEGKVVLHASSLPLPVPMTTQSAPPALLEVAPGAHDGSLRKKNTATSLDDLYFDSSATVQVQQLPVFAPCLFPPCSADHTAAATTRSLPPSVEGDTGTSLGPHLPIAGQHLGSRGDLPAAIWSAATDSLPPDQAQRIPQVIASTHSLPAMEHSQRTTVTDAAEPSSVAPTEPSVRSANPLKEVWNRMSTAALTLTTRTMRARRVESDRRKRWCSEVMRLTSESMQEVIEQVGIQAVPSDFVEFLWSQTFDVYRRRKRTIKDPTSGNERIVLLPSLELRVATRSSLRRGSSSSFVDLMNAIQEEAVTDDTAKTEGIPFTDFQSSMAFVVDRLINAGPGWKDVYAAFKTARQADKGHQANNGRVSPR